MSATTPSFTSEQSALEVVQSAFGPEHHLLEIWADMPADDNACQATVNQSREIADFLVRSEGYEVSVSLFGEEDQPFGFTLICDGDSADHLPEPSILTVHDDGRMAFTYLISTAESAEEITALAKAVKPGDDDDYELSADVPLPRAGWSLDSRTTYQHYAVAVLREAFGLDARVGMSADVPAHWNLIGEFPAGVLDHPVHASKLPSQFTKKAKNVFADVRGLYNHIAVHPESVEKEGSGIVGAVFDDDEETGKPRRKIRNAMTVGFIGFDFDGGQTEEEAVARLRARGITFATYSSFNHLRDGETHKFRVIIPLAIPFDTSDYKSREHANAVWKTTYERVADELGFECDLNTKDIARFFNSPRHPAGGEYFSQIYGGALLELPIVGPSESKVAKIAKKCGVKLAYDATGEVHVKDGSGLDFYLSLIGDGEDQLGFHSPIYKAMCAHFANDPDAEIGPIMGTIRKAVQEAPKGPARSQSDIERYMSESYLAAEAENARAFTAAQKELERAEEEEARDVVRNLVAEMVESGAVKGETFNAIGRGLVEIGDAGFTTEIGAQLKASKLKVTQQAFKEVLKDQKSELSAERKNAAKQQRNPEDKPVFYASDSFPQQVKKLHAGIELRNGDPRIFLLGNQKVRLRDGDESGAWLEPMGRDEWRYEANESVTFLSDPDDPDSAQALPKDVSDHVMVSPNLPLPTIKRIVKTPVHGPDGTLKTNSGYQRNGCYYQDTRGLKIKFDPENITDDMVREAVGTFYDVLHDFPFSDDFGVARFDKYDKEIKDAENAHGRGSRANAIAMMLQPLARELYDGPTPGFFLDKPKERTGATLLAEVVARMHLGSAAPLQAFPNTDEEFQKNTTGKLRRGAQFLIYDNIPGKVSHPSFAMLLTGEKWSARLLGLSVDFEAEIRSTTILTGNNVKLSDENSKRVIPIRLDAGRSDPEARTKFRHDNLKKWVLDNRGELVRAGLILIQNWIDNGKKLGEERLAGFSEFTRTMGGILRDAGIEGFMTNMDAFRAAKPEDGLKEESFMQELFAKHGANKWFTSAEAHDVVMAKDLYSMIGLDERDETSKQRGALTRFLGTFAARHYGVKNGNEVTMYRFEKHEKLKDGYAQWRFIQPQSSS